METQNASGRMCEEISELSGGVCFLGFSRGKDAIAAWLRLREHFARIIPFHCASVPGLAFVDRSLSYYEEWFQTPILRFMDGACACAVYDLVFQPPDHGDATAEAISWRFDKHDITAALRHEMNLPHAWCAYGINQSDSIDRRIYVNKYLGRIDSRRSFYPCWDWSRAQILESIHKAGIELPPDYRMANRTLAGVPSSRHLPRLAEQFPEDYDRVKLMFPMIEAELARQHFRRQHFEATT
jgi:hypothetical protein